MAPSAPIKRVASSAIWAKRLAMSSLVAMRLLMSKIVVSHACRCVLSSKQPGILNGDRGLGCEHRQGFAICGSKVSSRLDMRDEEHAHEPIAIQERFGHDRRRSEYGQ